MIICSHSWRAGRAAVLSNLFEMSIIWDIARQVTPSREVTTRTTGIERWCHPNVSDMLRIAIQHVILQEWMKIQVLRYQTYILLIFSGFRGPKVTQRWRWYPAESSRKQEAVTFSWMLIEKYHMFDSIHPYPSYTIIPIERPGYSLRIYPEIWIASTRACASPHFASCHRSTV